MSLDVNTFKNFLINEMFEYNNEGKRINRSEGKNKFNLLSQILKDCNAVIAGGGVLSAYVDSHSELNDIDIYVNKKNAIKLKNRIKEIGYTDIFKGDIQSQYDNSFFVKNNIIARFPVARKGTRYLRQNTYIDIIIVSDNVDVIQVVNNSDLTFCEIWYDGTHVHAADPKGVLEKKGYLKKYYAEKLLVCFNKFTIKRIDKYKNRGFEIRYDPKVNLSEIILNNDKDCDGKIITSPEKWVAGFIFKTINLFLFLPDIFKYIDINNLRNISPFSSMLEFSEFLPIYNLRRYDKDYGNPRHKEAIFFFKNILFDILCKCTTDNVYSIDSVKKMLDCLGVKPDKRKEFISGLIAHTKLYDDEYYEYILDIVNISKEDIKKYNNMYLDYKVEDEVSDEEMESDEEDHKEKVKKSPTSPSWSPTYSPTSPSYPPSNISDKEKVKKSPTSPSWSPSYSPTSPSYPPSNISDKEKVKKSPTSPSWSPTSRPSNISDKEKVGTYKKTDSDYKEGAKEDINGDIDNVNILRDEDEEDMEESDNEEENTLFSRKRKRGGFDSEEDKEDEEIINITGRMSNLRPSEDNKVRKKRKPNNDSGENDDDVVVFVNKSNNGQFHKINFNKSYLESIIRNKNNLFYECNMFNSVVTPIVIYVKIPINYRKTAYCFIPIYNLKKIVSNNSKIYHLYPVLQNQRQKIIHNYASLNNKNKCINDENIPVYELYFSPRVYFEGQEISERYLT